MALTYFDFQLKIERTSDAYSVEVQKSLAGTPRVTLPAGAVDFDLDALLAGIGRPARRITPGTVDAQPPPRASDALRAFGTRLYQAFLPGQIEVAFRQSLVDALDFGGGLRIRLDLATAPELAALPWEYLYDPVVDDFCARSTRTPLVRCSGAPQGLQPLPVDLPLRLLVIVAGSRDGVPVEAEVEWRTLRQALSEAERDGRITVDRVDRPAPAQLRDALSRGGYHVLHLVGHTGDAVWRTQDGEAPGSIVSVRDLAQVLGHGIGTLRLAVLSPWTGSPQSTDPGSALVQPLVGTGLPAAIAMQFAIAGDASAAFAGEFYGRVARGVAIDEALGEVRRALSLRGHVVEWGAPALFMNTLDGRLFEVLRSPAGAGAQPVSAPAARAETPASPQPAAEPAPAAGPARVNFKILKWFVDRTRQRRIFELMLDQQVQKQVMLVEAPTHMGKTWLINWLLSECQHRQVTVAHFDLDLLARRPLDYLSMVREARDQLGAGHFAEMTEIINEVATSGGARAGGPPAVAAILRDLLRTAYTARTLSRLSETPEFEELRYRFSPTDNLDEMIDEVLEFCRTHLRWEALLDAVAAEAPEVYGVFAVREGWPARGVPAPAVAAATGGDASVRDNLGSVGIGSDDVRREVRARIVDAFFRCLTRLCEQQVAVFLVDAYEKAPDDMRAWVEGELLYRIRLDLLPQMLVVVAGQHVPEMGDDFDTFVVPTDLEPFTVDHVSEYLKRRGIADLDPNELNARAKGHPREISVLVEEALLGL